MGERAVIMRGFRYRLYPTPEQAALFEQYAGVCRLIYNLAWEQRRDWWRQFERNIGSRLGFAAQCRELTRLRAEFDWISAVPAVCQEQALRDLDRAFANFFAGRARYPGPRKKGVNDSFRFKGREVSARRLNGKWTLIRLPKIGWVKFMDTRPRRGTIKNATVSHDATGWHISFACEIEHAVPENCGPAVGVDRGVATTVALSTGEMLAMPTSLSGLDVARRRAQRALSRRKRGSRRYAKQRRRVARIQAKAVRVRRDFHHRAALDIARRFGVAVLEDLKIPNMTARGRGKRGLNRSILAQGWHQFESILTYKMEERGGRVVKVPAAYSSQTCSACGVIDARSRKSQAIFECVHCGHRDNADVNAAKEILRRGNTSHLDVEGLRQRPREASTRRGLASETLAA